MASWQNSRPWSEYNIIPPAPCRMAPSIAADYSSSEDDESSFTFAPTVRSEPARRRNEGFVQLPPVNECEVDVVTVDIETKAPPEPRKLTVKIVPVVLNKSASVRVSTSLTSLRRQQKKTPQKKKKLKKERKTGCGCLIFKPDDLAELNAVFDRDQYPPAKAKQEMAVRFGVSLKQLDEWFYRKRRLAQPAADGRHFDKAKLAAFWQAFERNNFPPRDVIEALARRFNMSPYKVKIWFSYARGRQQKKAPKGAAKKQQRSPSFSPDQVDFLRREADWRLQRPDLPRRDFILRNRILAAEYNVSIARISSYIRFQQVRATEGTAVKAITPRIAFSKKQLDTLNREFDKSKGTAWSMDTKRRLAAQLGVPQNKVNTWYNKKRLRTAPPGPSKMYTAEQYKLLEKAFRVNQKPSRPEMTSVAEMAHLKFKQVQQWFSCERVKIRMKNRV